MKLNSRGSLRWFVLASIALALVLVHQPKANNTARESSSRFFYSTLELPVYASELPQTTPDGAKKDAPPAPIPLPDGKGKDTAKRICSGCHGTDTFASQGHTREKWSSIIGSMGDKGMDASDEEIAQILDYLTASFPPPPDKSDPAAPANPPQSN